MTGAWWGITSLCGGLFLLGTWQVARRADREEPEAPLGGKLALLLICAGLLRVALAATTRGYAADITTFSAWAGHAVEGLTSFYSPGYFADYPPGYIYILWLIGKLRIVLGIDFDTPAFLVLLKLPAVLADCATAGLLFRLARRCWSGTSSLMLAGLYAFNPAVILDSAVWGQVDSVLTLPILLGVMLLEKRPAASGAAFAAALLIKPQALIFAPLPLLWFGIRFLRRERSTTADLLMFSGTAIALFCLVILPFTVNESPFWIISKYGSTLASYPYATLNAYNLFALTGANTAPVSQHFLFLPYGAWGNIFILLTVLFTTAVMLRGQQPCRFWYTPLFLSASVFVMTAKMHERYLFPALALALGFHILTRDRLALLLFAGFSVTQFFNVAHVLTLSHDKVYGVPSFDPLLLAVSLANMLLWLLLLWAGYRHYVSAPGGKTFQAASG
jgi:dolichyl-phosphate-mannose-protein mannosyltransferase